jgi:hypothetical protein
MSKSLPTGRQAYAKSMSNFEIEKPLKFELWISFEI